MMTKRERAREKIPPRFCRDCGHGHHITTAHLNQQGEPVLLNCDITGKAHLLSEESCKFFLLSKF